MTAQNKPLIFIGESVETVHLLRAAFANKLQIVQPHTIDEVKKAVRNNNIRTIVADCSDTALFIVSKMRRYLERNHVALILSGLENKSQAIENELKKVKGSSFYNIKNQAKMFVDSIKSNPVPRSKKLADSGHFVSSVKTPLDKRIFDIVVSGFALLLLSPLFLLVMLAIKIEDKGPAVYLSKRVGSGYRIFNLIKFRTMYTDADKRLDQLKGLNMYAAEQTEEIDLHHCPRCEAKGEPCSPQLVLDGNIVCEYQYKRYQEQQNGGVFMKFKNDPRITKVGKILRNTSIDELPQLINVFLGHMSLVGNRPLPLYEAEQLTADGYVERFLAPAGLTGLWQVLQRGKEVSMEERIEMDNEYARNYSLWYDLKIILKTFPALLQQENV